MSEDEITPDGIDRGLNILLTVKERFEALGGKAVIALNPGDYESAVEVLKAAGRPTSFLKRAGQDEEERTSGAKFTFHHEEDHQSSDSEILEEEPDPRLPLWYQQDGPLVPTKRAQDDSKNLGPKLDPRLPQWYQRRFSSESTDMSEEKLAEQPIEELIALLLQQQNGFSGPILQEIFTKQRVFLILQATKPILSQCGSGEDPPAGTG